MLAPRLHYQSDASDYGYYGVMGRHDIIDSRWTRCLLWQKLSSTSLAFLDLACLTQPAATHFKLVYIHTQDSQTQEQLVGSENPTQAFDNANQWPLFQQLGGETS